MAKGTPKKINRNKKLIELKAKMTFKNLAKDQVVKAKQFIIH